MIFQLGILILRKEYPPEMAQPATVNGEYLAPVCK